jgi:SAM-dependent methyltransferase
MIAPVEPVEPAVPAGASGYLLDNRAPDAEQRFDSLGALFDPVTFRHLERLGISEGWSCWEVGAGGTSVLQWLAARVGRTGRIVATDIDTRWAQHAAGDNIAVQQHDVAVDEPPEGPFDLVHARLVLIHIPLREQALHRMVSSLRPGGWLLIEDFDPGMQPFACPDPHEPEEELANKVRNGFRALLAQRGAELELGRRLPRLLRETGLVDVSADAYLPLALPATLELEKANVRQVRDELVGGGHATPEEVDRHLANLDAAKLDVAMSILVSAWGRKP